MVKTLRSQLSHRRYLFLGLSLGLLVGQFELCAEVRKYLPRLGPTPIQIFVPAAAPVPFLLPPLDMGKSEDSLEDDSLATATKSDEGEKENRPKRTTRTTAISSRPNENSGSVEPKQGSSSGDGVSQMGPHDPEAEVDSLLPDGFDIGLDKTTGDRRDLSLFLNYFAGQAQRKRLRDQEVRRRPSPEATPKTP